MNQKKKKNPQIFPLFVLYLLALHLPPPLPPGMYEGIRLSDAQKGWFPVGNVIEITNEHVRRRNLRERYRVLQAASRVTKMNTIN